MRKQLVIGSTALALMFGGAGVANATEFANPAPATTTIVAADDQDNDHDNTGLWGLAGLLGLLGLAGLKRRKAEDHRAVGNPNVNPNVNPPRV